MRWKDITVSGREIILEGAPWKLGDEFFYFPASQFLIKWKDFEYHYDDITSEMILDSYLTENDFKSYITIYDMLDKGKSLEGLKSLHSSSYHEGKQEIKDNFRRLIT